MLGDEAGLVAPMPVEKRITRRADAGCDHRADDDGVAVPLDEFLDFKVDGRERIREERGARFEALPLRAVIARFTRNAAAPGEAIGDRLLPAARKFTPKAPACRMP